MRSHTPKKAAAAAALAAIAALLSTAPHATADVLADRDVTLTGHAAVTVLEAAGTTCRINYEDGDGNHVVLIAAGSAGRGPSAGTQPGGKADRGLGTTDTPTSGLAWWPYVLAVGLLIGLVMPTDTPRDRRVGGRPRQRPLGASGKPSRGATTRASSAQPARKASVSPRSR